MTHPRLRGLDDVQVPLADMLALGPHAEARHARVRGLLGEHAYESLIRRWPRSSAHELLLVHTLVESGFDVVQTSMRAAGAPMLVVGIDTVSYAGDERQLSLLRCEGEERWMIFPEIRIRVPDSGALYRVDFVIRYEDGEGVEWAAVEADGDSHRFTRERDKARARDLKMPTVRVENAALREPGVSEWLTFSVRKQIESLRDWRERNRRTSQRSAG